MEKLLSTPLSLGLSWERVEWLGCHRLVGGKTSLENHVQGDFFTHLSSSSIAIVTT